MDETRNHNCKKMRTFITMWKLNNTFLNNYLVKEEIKRTSKTYLETNKNEIQYANTYRMQQKQY